MAIEQGGTVRWVVEADTESFDQSMDEVSTRVTQFSEQIEQGDKTISGLKSSLSGILKGGLIAGATGATTALTVLLKKGIQATDFLETARVSMSGLTGSIQEGNKAMSIAANYWQNNPFQRIDVTKATQQLIQFGRKTSQLSDDLELLGNVSLSTGTAIDELARYYARTAASGRAMTMDIEMMSSRGIPIYRELAEALHTTEAGVRELASQGKIDFETFRKAMEGAVDADAMKQYEDTLARQIDRIKGSVQILAGQMAGYKIINDQLVISEEGLEKAWTRLIKVTATALRSDAMKEAMEKIGNALAKIVDKLAEIVPPLIEGLAKALSFVSQNGTLLLPVLGGVLVAFGKLGSRLPVIGGLIGGVSDKFSTLASSILSLAKANPILATTVAIFGAGFVSAVKNSQEFRDTISSLLKTLGKLATTLMDAVKPIINVLVKGFQAIVESGAVQTILQVVADALLGLANALASIPEDVLTGIITFFATMMLMDANPIYVVIMAVMALSAAIKNMGGLGKVFANIWQGIKDVMGKIGSAIWEGVKFIASIPQRLMTIAHNMIVGLVNGLVEGAKTVYGAIKNIGANIVATFKNVLQIHSPSKATYEIGEMVTLGLADGITDSSNVVQKAIDNLAKDVLSLSEKVIKNKVDFNIIDINGQYKAWRDVSKLFTVGSQQYATAIEHMEDARKQANLQILQLQESYNNKLDESIDKISKMYGLFDEVKLGGGKNSSAILRNLDQQVAKMQEWASAQEMISGLDLDPKFIEELQQMGVDATYELSAIANMTTDELSTLNDMWLQKQAIANKEGIRQMENLKNDTLDQIAQLKDGIDGEMVDVEDVGGRLVSHIGEGVYGAMPTLESAFANLNDYIAKAAKEISKTAESNTEGLEDSIVPDTAAETVSNNLEEISDAVKDWGSKLPIILGGIVAGVVGYKFLSKIVKGLLDKKTLSNLTGVLGNIKLPTDSFKKVTEATGSITKSAGEITKTTESVGRGMAKANSWMSTIKQGAQTVIWVAGAIAAVAGALWITYQALKDVDFGKLALALTEMAAAVAGMGALAYVAGKLKSDIGYGLLVVAGIAADIAVVAIACRSAYELMKDIPWDGFASVLGQMAVAIATFGVLNGILGINVIAIAEGFGLLVSAGIIVEIISLSNAIREAYDAMKGISWEDFGNMLGQMATALGVMGALNAPLGLLMPLAALSWVSISLICDEMVKLARALVEVDNSVPEDFTSLEKKLQNLKNTLVIINGLDLGTVIGMMVTSWSAGPVERIMEMYVKVAEALNKLSKIELDKDAIDKNLDYIKETLETIDAKTGVISGWLQASRMDMEASTVENAGRIVIVYGNMVDALNKLSGFKPNKEAITSSLMQMASVISLLREQSYGNNGIFNIFNNMGTIANDVEKIKSIVANYLEMVPTFQELGKDENQISDDVKNVVNKNIGNIKSIVTTIGQVDTGGWIDQKESDMGKIQSILNKYTELEPVIYQISQMNLSYLEGNNSAKAKIEKIRNIVLEIGRVDTGGWIEQKENDVRLIQSILNKFTEVAQTCGLLSKYPVPENAIEWIQKVRHLVWEIGRINQDESGSLDNKASIIEKSKTIATKLMEFASLFKGFEATDNGGLIQTLTDNLYLLTANVQNTLTEQAGNFENVGAQLGQSLAIGAGSQVEAMTTAGNSLQNALWTAIEAKIPDEYLQGVWMAIQFGNGLKSVNFNEVGSAIQSAVWWGIQNKMQDEYYQGQTMGYRFRQGLYDVDYGNAGWWAVQGFIDGAWAQYGNVYNTGWWVANRFLQGLRDRGQQGSPWKTTMESGAWAVEGLIEGMKDSEVALVGEATTLADEVVDALTMDNLTLSPELNPSYSGLAPSMAVGESQLTGATNGNVIIEQTNNNYTEYDIDRVNSDLMWMLAKA